MNQFDINITLNEDAQSGHRYPLQEPSLPTPIGQPDEFDLDIVYNDPQQTPRGNEWAGLFSITCGNTCQVVATCTCTCGNTCGITCGNTCGITCGNTCGITCGNTCGLQISCDLTCGHTCQVIATCGVSCGITCGHTCQIIQTCTCTCDQRRSCFCGV
jgi:hypothetical protein